MVLFRSGLHFVPPWLNSWASVVVSPSAVTNWVEVVPLLRGHAILLHCYKLHCVQSDSALHWISTECQNFLHVLDELCVWWKISCVQKWRAPDETNFKKVCGFGLNVSRRYVGGRGWGGSYTDMGDTTDHRPVVCLVYLDCTAVMAL